MGKVTNQERQKWEGLTDFFQYGSLVLLFMMIFILESLSKDQARVVVWYLAGVVFIFATIGFIIGRISIKKTMAYFNGEQDRIKRLYKDL